MWLEQFVNKRGCRADGSRCSRDRDCCAPSNCLRYDFGPFGIFHRYRCGLYGSGGVYVPGQRGNFDRGRDGSPPRCGGDGHRCGRK
ncbi:unnamed protein product [Didymodactylos carnosus]|uniref:Uncharacterized protein n=1 Tax=Didymodactylos carnosus TaxID=1234261 RepID=A0A815C7T7_9BILA|nr:unnamed protein product [Didymodactylos carnosus]CAF1281557.1 unnamed protein product [Didymodactylos carnosus]CAF3642139.1 unnamed protein product [Didymodactylos carnosus]CAF4077388.1 unnamed protein product [Didymodactylos carnosus]